MRQARHLSKAKIQRTYYQHRRNQAKEICDKFELNNNLNSHLPSIMSCALHYSFDFAQQVFYPHNPFQPGPVYFLTPRKCQLFGVHSEGLGSQVNFLLDEGVACGKGANTVVSLLRHYLEHYSIEKGNVFVPVYDWTGFFKDSFKKIEGILGFQEFYISDMSPFSVCMKEFSDSPSIKFALLKKLDYVVSKAEMPNQVIPAGLRNERQIYLYEQIREFCTDDTKDTVCPKPVVCD